MLAEQGRVVKVDDDSLWVETEKTSTCSSCSMRHGCGHKLLTRTGGMTVRTQALLLGDLAQETWEIGDKVSIEVEENAFLRASILVFGVPILFALSMVLAFEHFSHISEQLVAFAGLFGLIAGGLIVRRSAHINSPDDAAKFQIVVSRRLID